MSIILKLNFDAKLFNYFCTYWYPVHISTGQEIAACTASVLPGTLNAERMYTLQLFMLE
jgi:hypothetical protein